jgi:hypothetical protein
MQKLTPALAAALLALASLALPARAATVNGKEPDAVLQKGDILIKFLGEKTKLTAAEVLITKGQKAIQEVAGRFHKALQKGNASGFHVAVYTGGGKTAEAHGGDLRTAHVGMRALADHDGYVFVVFRPADRALADEAAAIAETWATGRMKYLVPAGVAVHRSSFGPKAKEDALLYGKNARTAGGPPEVKAMFCDEFAIAVYQAAAAARQLAKNPRLEAKQITMPAGLDLDARHASPMAFDAQLEEGVEKKTFTQPATIVVHK